MNNDKLLGVDIVQSAVTVGLSITQAESILNITILIVQCCYILYRVIFNIVSAVKSKQYAKIGESILTLESDLQALIKKLQEESMSTDDESKRQEIEEKIVQAQSLIDKYGNK